MGTGDRAVLRVLGGVAVVLAIVLVLLPVHASSGDAAHDCGRLMARHGEPLRRAFCDQRGAYRDRMLEVGGVAVAACLLAAAGRRRQRSSTPGTGLVDPGHDAGGRTGAGTIAGWT